MHLTTHHEVLLIVFLTAVVLGAVANKTNFCTMGAVSDWVNMGDTGRLRAWIFAIAIAMAGVLLLESTGVINIPIGSGTFPPYRTPNFAWLRYVLGGFLFGIGMTLGSGCGNKTLIRVGAGNIKSLVVLVFAAAVAYAMLWTDFFGLYIFPAVQATTIDLARHGIDSQQLGTLVGGLFGASASGTLNVVLGSILALVLFFFVFRSKDFRGSFDNILGGATVGAAVLMGWWVTGGSLGARWIEDAQFSAEPPSRVAVQSYTFISPMGDSFRYVMHPTHLGYINFGIMALTGVIVGSFLYAVITRKFRIEWFVNGKDAANHVVGGVLMGFGGVLAMGCTIGQGITGFSSLAVGSMLAWMSIVFGAALTMKTQYYLLDEQGFAKALRMALADMRLMPAAK
jgi:uncharacterized membrane protein YedE/YeeE